MYVDNVGQRVWVAMWKIYKTKTQIQMKASTEWGRLTFTGDMHRDIRACILHEKGGVAEAAQDILERK